MPAQENRNGFRGISLHTQRYSTTDCGFSLIAVITDSQATTANHGDLFIMFFILQFGIWLQIKAIELTIKLIFHTAKFVIGCFKKGKQVEAPNVDNN